VGELTEAVLKKMNTGIKGMHTPAAAGGANDGPPVTEDPEERVQDLCNAAAKAEK
jgi:hypothetical protein